MGIVHDRVPIESLPEELRTGFPAGTHVRVMIERAMTDEQLLEELDRQIAKGTADLKAGRVHSANDVRAWLTQRFGRGTDAA